MPMTNPKAWEAVTGFTANIKAAIERLHKLASYFPESEDQLTAVAARIEAEGDRTMEFLLAEALTGRGDKLGDSGGESPIGTGGF